MNKKMIQYLVIGGIVVVGYMLWKKSKDKKAKTLSIPETSDEDFDGVRGRGTIFGQGRSGK